MNRQYVPNYKDCVYRYTQWHQGEFLKDIKGMRGYEIAVYTVLLNEMYERGEALSLNTDRLARMCGVDKRAFVQALDTLIDEGKIIRLDCGLWSEKCEESFTSREELREVKRKAGGASAEKRNKINGRNEQVFNRCSTSKIKSNIDISSLRSDISYAQNHDFERDFDLAEEDFGIEDFGNSEALAPQPEASPEALTSQAPERGPNEPPPLQEPNQRQQRQAVASPPLEPTTEPLEWPEPPEPLEAAPTLTPPGGMAGAPSRDKRTSELLRAWEMAALEELERERRASEIEAMDAAGTPPTAGGVQTRPEFAHPQEPNQQRPTEPPPLEAVARPQVAAPRLEPAPSRLEFEPGGVTDPQRTTDRRTPEPVTRAQASREAAPEPRRAPSKASTLKAQFEREFDAVFWPAVVRKVGKASAKKAFPKARAKASLEAIMSGLERYQASRAAKGVDIQFWAHPTTFLNAERWDDEPDPTIITNTRKNNHEQSYQKANFGGGQHRSKGDQIAKLWLEFSGDQQSWEEADGRISDDFLSRTSLDDTGAGLLEWADYTKVEPAFITPEPSTYQPFA